MTGMTIDAIVDPDNACEPDVLQNYETVEALNDMRNSRRDSLTRQSNVPIHVHIHISLFSSESAPIDRETLTQSSKPQPPKHSQ
jgi:hypothetical protein